MKKPPTIPEILNRGSLLTYQDKGQERCLGYLMDCPGHGIFEPTFGKLEVTSEEAKTHNALLSQAEIHGLDHNCAVGMGGVFYLKRTGDRTSVTTWLGELVSEAVQIRNQRLTFHRQGKVFRGRLRRGADSFAFRRVASPATHSNPKSSAPPARSRKDA